MAENKKPSNKKLKQVDSLLEDGKTLDQIAEKHPELKAAVEYRRSHQRARAGGAAPEKAHVNCDAGAIL